MAARQDVDRLRAEAVELRASRERLVLAADADRRQLERELHEGVQQHLVALAVSIQLAESLLESDPAAAKTLLRDIGRDVQHALDEAAQLAQHIYAPQLELGGFAAALRFAAVSSGTPASVDVSAGSGYPAEVLHTIYVCWLDALRQPNAAMRPAVTVREHGDGLTFEIVRGDDPADARLESLRDRVETLGGRMSIEAQPGRGVRVCGSLPRSR